MFEILSDRNFKLKETVMVNKVFRLIAAAFLSTMTLTGCVSTGAYNGFSSDAMRMLVVWRSDHKPLTTEQYILIQDEATFCHITFANQLTSAGEAIFTDGALGTVANAVSVGNAAHAAFGAAAEVSQYATYGGGAASLPNGLAGAKGWSYAMVTAVGMCTETDLRDLEKFTGNPAYVGLHAAYVPVRSKNATNKPASGVVQNWTGPTAGSTTRTSTGS